MPDKTITVDITSPSLSRIAGHGRNDRNIDIRQTQDLRVWTMKFGVTPEDLKAAVSVVGTNVTAVQRYLRQTEEDDEGHRH